MNSSAQTSAPRAIPSFRCVTPELDAFGHSVIGKHRLNEDAYLVEPRWGCLAVADGVGGAPAGNVASRAVIQGVRDAMSADLSLTARAQLVVFRAHRWVEHLSHGPRAGMASTLAFVLLERNEAIVGHAGDSRVYRLRDGELEQLTEDHSVRNDMLREGITLSPAHARAGGALTRCVTARPGVGYRVELSAIRVEPGDRLLLCTDGLTKVTPHEVIAELLARGPAIDAVHRLEAEARRRFARDDVTVVVSEILG